MKGYCVDVRGFSIEKKRLVAKAIGALISYRVGAPLWDGQDILGNVSSGGEILGVVAWGVGKLREKQIPHQISFNDLMLEVGFNYEENGVEDFKMIDWSECEAYESKLTSNKTRPQITREQYDAVMAQSDKRTFTKALDDLLAIEKEQVLDESAVRINRLEDKCARLNLAIGCQNEQLSANSYTIDELRDENDRLFAGVTSWRESWERAHNLNIETEFKLKKHKRISGVLSLLLISSVAAQLAVIFLGG